MTALAPCRWRWPATLLVALALSGCAGGHPDPGAGRPRPDVTALDAAVGALNRTRATVLADAATVGSGASALDRADGLAAAGSSEELAKSYDGAHAAAAAAAGVLPELTGHLTAYADALDRLGAVAQGAGYLPSQQQALTGVVAAGHGERRALVALAAAAGAGWPAYAGLDATVGTWLGRAVAGWYRSTKEAANAYAVLAGAGRGALDASRSSLAAADGARASAAAGMTAALRTAGEATAALRSG